MAVVKLESQNAYKTSTHKEAIEAGYAKELKATTNTLYSTTFAEGSGKTDK
jgi:hypothetical protein